MALEYTASLDQSQSHNGYERYTLLPTNGGRDAYRFEYIRDFDLDRDEATQAELDKRDALRAFLLLALNDDAILGHLADVYNDASVTDEDSFIAAIAARLAA